jgi:hypothetical protein
MPMSCARSDTAAYLPIVTIRKLRPNTNQSNINTYPPTRVRTTLGCRSSPYPIPTSVKRTATSTATATTLRKVWRKLYRRFSGASLLSKRRLYRDDLGADWSYAANRNLDQRRQMLALSTTDNPLRFVAIPRLSRNGLGGDQWQSPRSGFLGSRRDFTCSVTALIKHVEYFRCHPCPTGHFRRFSSRKANTSGSQMFTPRWRKSCPSSTVWPMGG